MRKSAVITSVGALLLAIAGCSSAMTVEQKYEHLRDVANRGADAHFVLINENKETTREICDQHYKVFVPDGAPPEDGQGFSSAASSVEWKQLSLDYFTDSCVSGEPREIKTRPTSPPPSPSSTPNAPAPAEVSPPTPAG